MSKTGSLFKKMCFTVNFNSQVINIVCSINTSLITCSNDPFHCECVYINNDRVRHACINTRDIFFSKYYCRINTILVY